MSAPPKRETGKGQGHAADTIDASRLRPDRERYGEEGEYQNTRESEPWHRHPSPCSRVRRLRIDIRLSLGRAVVVPQQPAQPVPAADLGPASVRGCRGDQLIPEPLMVPLPVVVRHELVEGAEQRRSPNRIRRSKHPSRIERTIRSA
jgi:hypothetical protein